MDEEDICPITLCKLPADPLDVAYIWSDPSAIGEGKSLATSHGCGHKCTLRGLIGYMNSVSAGGVMPMCPVCLESPIVAICDGAVMADRERSSYCWNSFRFRYGKQSYRLAVATKPATPSWHYFYFSFLTKLFKMNSKNRTVQKRISQSLQLDEKSMKILRKGKIVYPDPNISSVEEMSNLLLELSSLDGNKKTSMIVMGTNVGSILKEPKAANLAMITTLLLVIRSFLRRLLNVAFSQAALFFQTCLQQCSVS